MIKDQILARTSSFPTLPVMVHKLMHVATSPEADANDIAGVIAYDPALTANVLRAANSAFLGFHREVGSLTEAAFRLGTKWIFQIAISSLIYSNVKRPAPGYDLSAEELWKHSAAVAVMSDNLCRLLDIKDAGAVFTAALLHDIGKIALGEFLKESFTEIQSKVDERNVPFEVAEQMVLGIDHAEVGALIAENWSFPVQIIEVIRWHHNPGGSADSSPSLDVVHVADAICLMEGLGIGRDGLQYHADERSIARLNLSGTILEKATCQLIDSLEDLENMFDQLPVATGAGR